MAQRSSLKPRGLSQSGVPRQSQKQADLYNTGLPGDNPFQSMYQATIGSRAQTAGGMRHNSQTPKMSTTKFNANRHIDGASKSASKLNFTAKREQNRRFGEYNGEDGIEGAQNTQSIWSPTPYAALPTGYQGSRQTRCTDRFVRYPYPKTLFSNYRQNFYGKLVQTDVKSHKKAFNLEKESKIINPHKMDLGTTNKDKFKGAKGERAARKQQEVVEPPKPIQQTSSYHASFPNWDNGKNDVFHEKHPQYPYYSLPFNGGSTYKQNFTERQARELKRMQDMLDSNHHSNSLKLSGYIPTNFDFTTTNSKNFKDFRFVDAHSPEKVQKCAPIVHPVQTKSLPGHFKTVNQRELKKHRPQNQVVDRIPYP